VGHLRPRFQLRFGCRLARDGFTPADRSGHPLNGFDGVLFGLSFVISAAFTWQGAAAFSLAVMAATFKP